MNTFFTKHFGDRVSSSYVERNLPLSDITTQCSQTLRSDIEKHVKEWLSKDYDPNDGSNGKLEIHLRDEDGQSLGFSGMILFTRYELAVPHCANGWTVYRVAEASNWPELITVRVDEIGVNDFGLEPDGIDREKPPVNTLVPDYARSVGSVDDNKG